MSGQKPVAEMTFREMECAIIEIERQAMKKVRIEYPEGVMVVFSHGPEERKAIVCDHSKHEMKIRVEGKTGKYWIGTHKILRAVCPRCESSAWATTGKDATFTLPETDYELCHVCNHQWGHR